MRIRSSLIRNAWALVASSTELPLALINRCFACDIHGLLHLREEKEGKGSEKLTF